MSIVLGMHVSPVESGKSRMHKYHSTARLGAAGGESQATGDHASKAVALNRGLKRYSPLHRTHNS